MHKGDKWYFHGFEIQMFWRPIKELMPGTMLQQELGGFSINGGPIKWTGYTNGSLVARDAEYDVVKLEISRGEL